MAQNYFSKLLKKSFLAVVIATPGLIFAGNIPQYQVSKGTNKYAEFSDGISISCTWNVGEYAIFPDGVESPNPRSAEGFPIGFNFKLGGKVFNQFVVENSGDVSFGNDMVNYGGDAFVIKMSQIKNGLKRASISYKTSGEEGNRILTIQFVNAILNEASKDNLCGKYSFQMRLYEADGKVEIALKEIETVGNIGNGFGCGILGWDEDDVILLTAKGIDSPLSVSPHKSVDMLEPTSYIKWDEFDFDHYYQPVYVFDPINDKTAPSESPMNLEVSQDINNLIISCKKAPSATATVVFYSQSPFTSSDFPINGETFIAGTKFGNATALYYGNKDNISVTVPDIESGTKYYIAALSANGYPAYAIDNATIKEFATSHTGPTSLVANSQGTKSVKLEWESQYPVIVLESNNPVSGYQKGYIGNFGTPTVNSKVGDEIEGGGKVVYIGDAAFCNLECQPNRLTFYRAWNIKESTLSATYADAYYIPQTSLPYEPEIENYPRGEKLEGWSALDDQYIAFKREYAGDLAVRAVSVLSEEVSLVTPEIDLRKPVKVTFEFAMETVRPPLSIGMASIPQGNKAGEFGEGGFLSVSVEGTTHKAISEYNGTMIAVEDGFATGSSTFDTFEVEMPAYGDMGHISFNFKTEETTYLYIKNIKVVSTDNTPEAPKSAPTNASADEDRNAILYFSCNKADDAENTLVLFSEKPITDANYPMDGVIPAIGSKINGAYVLYFGSDEEVNCQTILDMVVPDFGTTYYFVALSASANPLYNRENISNVEYTTLKEVGNATFVSTDFDEENMAIIISATRHIDASSTLILLSDGKFNGYLEDGRKYENGETVGNAIVLYHDVHESIEHTTDKIEPNKTYTLTAISANERGWWADTHATTTFNTITSSVDSIEFDVENTEIYNVMGIRIQVNSINDLPKGIYIINGKKINL